MKKTLAMSAIKNKHATPLELYFDTLHLDYYMLYFGNTMPTANSIICGHLVALLGIL